MKLTGDEILRQFFHQLSCCALINIDVQLFLSDAGGSNSRLFSLFRGGEKLGKDGWIPTEKMIFKNPAVEKVSNIAYCPCSTHGLKAIRNQLFSSSGVKDATRVFESVDGVEFGWDTIERIYCRDQKRVQLGGVPITKLDMKSVNPDRWSKMNVSAAKKPFSVDTILAAITDISETMGCFNDVVSLRSMHYSSKPDIVTAQKRILKLKEHLLKFEQNSTEKICDFEGDACILEMCGDTREAKVSWDKASEI